MEMNTKSETLEDIKKECGISSYGVSNLQDDPLEIKMEINENNTEEMNSYTETEIEEDNSKDTTEEINSDMEFGQDNKEEINVKTETKNDTTICRGCEKPFKKLLSHLNRKEGSKNCREFYTSQELQRANKQKTYYEQNKEQIRERHRKTYELNKEKIRERQNKNYEQNKERIRERQRKSYELNKESIRERSRQTYELNKERIRDRQRKSYELNKERIIKKTKEPHECYDFIVKDGVVVDLNGCGCESSDIEVEEEKEKSEGGKSEIELGEDSKEVQDQVNTELGSCNDNDNTVEYNCNVGQCMANFWFKTQLDKHIQDVHHALLK